MIRKITSPESLGQALRDERKHKHLSQEAVGHSVGIAQYMISKIENGNPGTELGTIFRVLAALDLELTIQPRREGSQRSHLPGNDAGDAW